MKKHIPRMFSIFFIILLLGVLAGPFLIPVPELTGLVPAQTLADPESQFITINGLSVHLKTAGQGDTVFLLLHGFGANLSTWHSVIQQFGQVGKVIAYDRPAFGLTERPLQWQGENPYGPDAQVELINGLLDHYGVKQAILVGNSAGGTAAMQYYLKYPHRVKALILVDPAVYAGGGPPAWIRPLLNTPQMRHLGPLFTRQIRTSGMDLLKQAWHDPSKITPETIDSFTRPLKAENWDKALWEFTLANRPLNLPQMLGQFTTPVLVITGDDDRIVPTQESIRLADELPNAELAVISQAGHVPHEEKPDTFMQAVENFLQSRDLISPGTK